jgi:hypothetical protein
MVHLIEIEQIVRRKSEDIALPASGAFGLDDGRKGIFL